MSLIPAVEGPSLTTPRLLLRPWRESDLAPFAALNADPRVMEHFPKCLSRAESDDLALRMAEAMAQRGFGWLAVEVPGNAPFIGFVGLSVPGFDAPFMPAVEVGWRLAAAHWRQGYAREAAQAALRFGFETLGLSQIVSFAVPANKPSLRVMESIGMTRDPAGDFDHPRLPEGHRLRRHVLYRIVSPTE